MACGLLYPRKRTLTNDIMSGNPSKKMRFESAGNDDSWGQDAWPDITAEEFDMLEVAATQSCNQTVAYANHDAHQVNLVNFDGPNSVTQVEDLKQLQYELEGRVKLLSHTLEKSKIELNQERLNREKIINERMKSSQLRENDLQKNVEKLQSILDFKEQEMKSVYNKLEVLKAQSQDKKNNCVATTSMNRNFEDFLTGLKSYPYEGETSKVISTNKFRRKQKLVIDTPRGNTESADIPSSLLCNRLAIPSFLSSENLSNDTFTIDTLNYLNCTPMSVIQLKSHQKCDDLLEYYKSCLKGHVISLKTSASRSNSGTSNKTSPLSARRKEANHFSSKTIISCLRDIMCILPSLKFHLDLQKYNDAKHVVPCNKELLNNKEESSLALHSSDVENRNISENTVNLLAEILESLLALANPKTFPNGYLQTEEIELSLSALFNICLICPKIFLEKVPELPIYSLLSPHHSITSVCITLKLITSLSASQSFLPHLVHKDSNCLLCSIATFMCDTLQSSPEKYAVPMLLIEDFLSSVLSVHTIVGNQLETAKCITEIIKGVVTSVWKYFQLKEQISCSTLIIKKGFLLLHFMSSYISSFKERRSQVEDQYISFISSLLTLSKENSEFREYHDLIHNLWDFQTDISEFDLDEASDETQSSANEMEVADSN